MYIFGRRRRINPAKGRAAMAATIEAKERASAILGFPVFAWTSVLGPDMGTVMWSTRFDHLDDAIAADDALWGNDEFASWAEQNDGLYVGPSEDAMSQVLTAAPTGAPGAFVQLTQAVCANGYLAEAMGLGMEVAETATRIGGHQTMFAAAVTGPYGGVGWLTSFPDLAAMEAGNAAVSASDEWLKLVDRAGHAFQPGVTSVLLRRLG